MRTRHFFILSLFTLLAAVTAYAEEKIADVLNEPTMKLSRASDRAKMVTQIRALENKRLTAAKIKARRLGLPMQTQSGENIAKLVDFIGDEPLYITTLNANAAISTSANLLQTIPYSLDGAGITVGVWDSATGNPAHQEFSLPGGGSRLTQMDSTFTGVHSAHVAGTVAAAGVDPAARGMAPAARVDAYNNTNDLSEMTSRAATEANQLASHLYLSNHSYGSRVGWAGTTWFGDGIDANAAEYRFGRYENISRDWDALAYNAPYYLIFRAVGNERDTNPQAGDIVNLSPPGGSGPYGVTYDPALHPPGNGVYRNGYDIIFPDAVGKNIMTIGAAEDAVTDGLRDITKANLIDMSSTGPVDDGRIKPDLVANGDSLYSTSDGTADYTSITGTSMATPSACGSAALLMQLYDRLFGGAMRASTLKGLMLHSADDLGNPGPDYRFGWGLVNVRRAADLLVYHDTFPDRQRLTQDEISSTDPLKTYSFEWDGVSPLRATLSWTDPAGVASGDEVHDSRVPTLVNDLNLKLIAPDGTTEYFPYVMPFVGTWTTESMSLPATTGVNHTDNVEQVRIESSNQDGTWQVEVTYSGTLTNELQEYGLLISEDVDSLNIDNTPPNPDPVTWERAPEAGGGPILNAVAGTDFTGRTIVNDDTATNITWTTTGASDPGDLTATAKDDNDLFDSVAAQGYFAPKQDVKLAPWTLEIPITLTSAQVELTDVSLDYQHFNRPGDFQVAEYQVSWSISLSGSSSGTLRSIELRSSLSSSGTETAVFDPPLVIDNTENYTLSITAGDASGNTRTGLGALALNGQFGIAGDPETEINMIATTATDLNGVEYYFAETTGRAGGDDSGWQGSPVYLDSGLIPGTTYSYSVVARDKSPFQNATTALAPASATTLGEQPAYYAWSGGMAFLADGNTDGVANGMAWFLGAADPQAAVSALLPSIDNSDPDDFILSYLPDSSALTAGAEATVYYSTDLTNWTAAVDDGANIIIDASADPVQVHFDRSLAPDGKFFVYLQVEMSTTP